MVNKNINVDFTHQELGFVLGVCFVDWMKKNEVTRVLHSKETEETEAGGT